tara:strand:+ start:1214 stop:2482 length:1269 start_codon:yes stop_codon:yes gene_type:complete
MNLSEMRSMVGSIVDYDPNVQTYRDEVNQIVNQIYIEFFTDRPWSFAQDTVDLQVYKDVTDSTGTLSSGASTVTVADPNFFLSSWMQGMILEISSTDNDNGEYIIQKVVSGAQVILEGFTAVDNVAATAGVTVKQRYVDMPQDCVMPVSVGIRDVVQGPHTHFYALSRLRDEQLNLLLSITGLPTDWILYDDTSIIQPVTPPTLALSGTGTFTEVGTYYAKYTFIEGTRESAPSPEASVEVVATTQINATNIQATGTNSGTLKRMYVRTAASKAYYHVSNVDIPEATDLQNNLALDATYLSKGVRLPEHGGNYQRVRLYPRQDTDYKVNIRYLKRPDLLIEDSDTPDFPVVHHRYLVYRACQELFVKHDNIAHSEVYRKKADIELLKIEQRFLTTGAQMWVKEAFSQDGNYYGAQTTLTHLG